MKTKTHLFVVAIDVDASQRATREYVEDAIRSMGGGGHPDSPFFGLQARSVRVLDVARPSEPEPEPQKTCVYAVIQEGDNKLCSLHGTEKEARGAITSYRNDCKKNKWRENSRIIKPYEL